MREDMKKRKKMTSTKEKTCGVEVEIVGLTPELQAMASGDYSGEQILPQAFPDE